MMKCPRCGSTRYEGEYWPMELPHAVCYECLQPQGDPREPGVVVPMVKRLTEEVRRRYSRPRSNAGGQNRQKVRA